MGGTGELVRQCLQRKDTRAGKPPVPPGRFVSSIVAQAVIGIRDWWRLIAASMKPKNNGCGCCGFELNSGWNCTATNQGWSRISTISGKPCSGLIPGDREAGRLEFTG